MKLKIHTDPSLILAGKSPVIMLFPFLGMPSVSADDPDNGRFNAYLETAKEIFELTDKNSCDIFVLPMDFSFDPEVQQIAHNFSEEAKRNGKKMLVFFNSDDDRPIPLSNVIIYRTSFYASRKKENEFAVPGWSIDFVKKYQANGWLPNKKSALPTVGYCGYVDYVKETWKQRIKKLLGNSHAKPWEKWRGEAVRSVMRSSKLQSNFILRDGFWASGLQDKNAARKEYAMNMLESDYTVVCRGGGNFSYRLYEVMSCGRIPIFIDTDCVLPFENEIPWKEIMVWIDHTSLNALEEKVCSFHSNLSEETFMKLQVDIRSYYEKFICPVGFFTEMAKSIHKLVAEK